MYATPPYPPNYPYPRTYEQDAMLTEGVLIPRMFAWAIDVCLCAVLVSALWVLLLILGLVTLGLGLPLLGILPLVPLLYSSLIIASPLSATPGQAMLGLAVRRNEDLGPPGFLRALASTLLFYVTVASSLGILWFLVVLVTERKRTLHDILSGTVIVRSRALTEAAAAWNMAPGGSPYR